MKTSNQNKHLITSNLALVATLALWFPIEKVDRQNPKRIKFVFERTKELDKKLQAYWDNKLKVSPQTYFDKLKTIKSRIYMGV